MGKQQYDSKEREKYDGLGIISVHEFSKKKQEILFYWQWQSVLL